MISIHSQSPQTFSHDMYVRLKAADIAQVELTHLYSELTGKAHQPQPNGVTEWTGRHGTHTLSIGWDWVILHDGLFSLQVNTVFRSNVMLVDRCGYDTDPVVTDREFSGKIATLGWQDVLQQLLQNGDLA